MISINCCQICGERNRSLVAEYNSLITFNDVWRSSLARSDYMLCHGCGLVYASLRPDRHEYDYLYENFNELTGRGKSAEKSIFMEPGPLTPALRRELDAEFLPWWELRQVGKVANRVTPPMVAEFDLAVGDLPMMLKHCTLKDSTVLQIRTKTASFADMLRRVFGVDRVDLVTLFPIHEYAAGKLGYRAVSCLDYENFKIPFSDRYDLIMSNHLFTHMLDAEQIFATLRSHLTKDGHLFIRQELDDTRLFAKGQSLFTKLLVFHFQQFDIPCLQRMLARFGFFAKELAIKKGSEIIGVAQLSDTVRYEPIGEEALRSRLEMYRQWREASIRMLPPERAAVLFNLSVA